MVEHIHYPDMGNNRDCCYLKYRSKKEREPIKQDNNRYPEKLYFHEGKVMTVEGKKPLAEGIEFYFKHQIKKAIEFARQNNLRLYISGILDNISLIRIIKPLQEIDIGYTPEQLEKAIEEGKKSRTHFENLEPK